MTKFATFDTLEQALPHILAAPKNETTVDQLCFRPDRNEREFPQQLTLTRDQGVPNERWLSEPWLRDDTGAPHRGIQVSILSRRVWDAVRVSDDMIHPGDTIIADLDTSMDNLPLGTRLRVGTAVIEVSDVYNEGCVKWKARYGSEAKDWLVTPKNRPLRLRGILCSIEEDGVVKLGDQIIRL